nr:myristylated tegument protein-like protein [Phocid alphaherpesvirus 1]
MHTGETVALDPSFFEDFSMEDLEIPEVTKQPTTVSKTVPIKKIKSKNKYNPY